MPVVPPSSDVPLGAFVQQCLTQLVQNRERLGTAGVIIALLDLRDHQIDGTNEYAACFRSHLYSSVAS